MNSTWFTSDTHFGHSNIIAYCSRPFGSAEEMDRVLIQNWNARIRQGDTVYHLGDLAWQHDIDALRRLRGKWEYHGGSR